MGPRFRRVLQATMYELVAIGFVGPVLSLAYQAPLASTLGLACVMSSVAMVWNYIFNMLFERWESRQSVRGRSVKRRLAHGIGFEGGLTIILVPVMSYWLNISPEGALVANLGLLAFFFIYAMGFLGLSTEYLACPSRRHRGAWDNSC